MSKDRRVSSAGLLTTNGRFESPGPPELVPLLEMTPSSPLQIRCVPCRECVKRSGMQIRNNRKPHRSRSANFKRGLSPPAPCGDSPRFEFECPHPMCIQRDERNSAQEYIEGRERLSSLETCAAENLGSFRRTARIDSRRCTFRLSCGAV